MAVKTYLFAFGNGLTTAELQKKLDTGVASPVVGSPTIESQQPVDYEETKLDDLKEVLTELGYTFVMEYTGPALVGRKDYGNQTADPTAAAGFPAPAQGDVYYNTTTNEERYFDGFYWLTAVGTRTHPAGTVAFFIAAGAGLDSNDGLTLGTAWKTLDRGFEAYQYARLVLGEEAMLTFNVTGATLTWPEEWLEAANVSFIGSDEDEVLASVGVSVSVESNVYNGGLLVTFSPDPGLLPGAGRDGTFIVDTAGLVDPRPVAEFVSSAVVRYGGNNSNTISLVTPNGLPQPCRMFTHGTTINLVGFGSSNRLIWDNVRFEKLDIGPDGESLRPSNGNVEFLECSVRANYLVEEDRVTVNRTWFRPSGFSNLGFFSFLGAVIDGAGSSNFVFNRGKITQFKNLTVFVEPPAMTWENASGFYTSGTSVTIQITEHPGLLPHATRKGPGTVMSLDNVRLLIEMSGVNTVWLDGDNQLLGGFNSGSEIKTQGGLADAVVTGMLRNPVHSASAPAVTDDEDNGISVGNQWIDTALESAYICTDSTGGAAVWKDFTAAGGGGLTAERLTYPGNVLSGNTIHESLRVSTGLKITGIKVSTVTTPSFTSAGGTFTLTVAKGIDGGGNNMLGSPTFNLEGLLAQTDINVTLTGTPADLEFAAAGFMRASVASSVDDLTPAAETDALLITIITEPI